MVRKGPCDTFLIHILKKSGPVSVPFKDFFLPGPNLTALPIIRFDWLKITLTKSLKNITRSFLRLYFYSKKVETGLMNFTSTNLGALAIFDFASWLYFWWKMKGLYKYNDCMIINLALLLVNLHLHGAHSILPNPVSDPVFKFTFTQAVWNFRNWSTWKT